MTERILVVGAGLAGLAAASVLGPRGFSLRILESRNRTGGRAGSFLDAATGQMLDNCQHVSMGCCTNLAHFCQTAGLGHLLEPQPVLRFMTPDRRVSRFAADSLPAPFHLARAFLQAHYLTLADKARIGYALGRLLMTPPREDLPFAEWLVRHGQTPQTIERFWQIVLVSALNEETDRVGTRYARKVFVEGFLGHRRAFEVQLPVVPLGELYGSRLTGWLSEQGVELTLDAGVRRFHLENGRISGVELRSGERLEADWYVSAVPFERLLDLLPEQLVESTPTFAQLRNLQTAPITSVHLWYDRPVCPWPHVVLVGCVGHWVFDRGMVGGEHYLQVVVSASRELRRIGNEEAARRVVEELRMLFPTDPPARLIRSRVITETAATFSVVPGVDRWRPAQGSPIPNLMLAGDWTATDWPATMEGAVRSGYLAAEALLARKGQRVRLVRPDL